MEQLLHYVWKHKLFPLQQLTTTDGRAVEVIDTGLHNRNSGPDFFNAKVKIDGTLWVGNVEIHSRASDWYLHKHETDAHYDNVILHVVETSDTMATTLKGETLPQMVLPVPAFVRENYQLLLSTADYPPCYKVVPTLSRLMIHSWMSALQTERLEQRTLKIQARADQSTGNWEAAYFVSLARNYGFGVNGDAFEEWANHIPLTAIAHHRNNLFQIEALFLGQAGLLSDDAIPQRHLEVAKEEGYWDKLRQEYRFLAHKFSLKPMDANLWKFLRLRPQNFPHIRIAQLATLYYERRSELASLIDCTTTAQVVELLQTHVTPYWETHYTFGAQSKQSKKQLSTASLQLLIINTVVPMLFAYGRHKGNEQLIDRAFSFLDQLKPETNHIVRMWEAVGLSVDNAGDSQALIQLKKEFCDRKECLRCRIGYEFLKLK